MQKVRDQLHELDHKLFESLIRSHDIAWNEWLPALSVQQDSYNSFPHIRNLEIYLDTIVNEYHECMKRNLFISPIEIYIILSSILFHDIGRINSKEKHAKESKFIISGNSDESKKTNYGVWAALGIPSYELALSIGRICEYHDLDKMDHNEKESLKNTLSSIYIDGYGEVRQKSLASLLVLLDHLDSAHTRIMPQYLRGANEVKVVGAFRRVITGVYVDLKAQMVRTVLNEKLPNSANENPNTDIIYKYATKHNADFIKLLKLNSEQNENPRFSIDFKEDEIEFILKGNELKIEQDLKLFAENNFDISKFNEAIGIIDVNKLMEDKGFWAEYVSIYDELKKTIKDTKCSPIKYKYIHKFFSKGKDTDPEFTLVDKLILNDHIRVDHSKNSEKSGWPEKIMQDLILGNIHANNKALQLIKPELEGLGIPIKAWLIDHKEHLYNCNGEETFEPIFNKSFLIEAAKRMWELSTQVFGVSYFSYENLAALLREPDIYLVKMAVRRISIIMTSGKEPKYAIMAGEINWRWVKLEADSLENEKNGIQDENLKDPDIVDTLERIGVPDVK